MDAGPEVRDLTSLDPRAFLAGATTRLVDEWQLAPDLWNVVHAAIGPVALGHPGFLAVVTGTEYAYTLPSGVHVVPPSALAT